MRWIRAAMGAVLAAGTLVAGTGVGAGPALAGQPAADSQRRDAAPRAVSAKVTAAGLAGHRTIDVAADASDDRRALTVRARVRSDTGPRPRVTVVVAQYDSVGGTRTRTPLIPRQTVEMSGQRRAAIGATARRATGLRGEIPWKDLRDAGSDIPVGQAVLMCVDSVAARAGSQELPLGPRVLANTDGRDCVAMTRRPRSADTIVNALVTGELSGVRLAGGDDGAYTMTFAADTVAAFRDAPDRSSQRSVPFRGLTAKKAWRQTFQAAAPQVRITVPGSTDMVTMALGRPVAVGGDRYRSRVSFPGDEALRPDQVRGKTLTFFGDAAPTRPQFQECVAPTRYVRKDPVPPASDFVGELGSATITARPGRRYLTLESSRPLAFHWFRSAPDCASPLAGAVDLEDLTRDETWREAFGTLKPNSSLVWQDGKGVEQVVEFEQEQPRWNPAAGTWTSRIRPLVDGLVPSRDSVRRWIDEHGRNLRVRSAHFFLDSTNSATNGGEYVIVGDGDGDGDGDRVQGEVLFVVDNDFQFDYVVDPVDLTISFTFQVKYTKEGWFGLGYHAFMFPADTFVASFNPQENGALSYFDGYNPGIPTLSFFPAPAPDTAPIFLSPTPNSNNNQNNYQCEDVTGGTQYRTVECTRKLITLDIFDIQFKIDGRYPVCAAYNLSLSFNTADYNLPQPSHQKVLCSEIVLY